jgi:hypothetical protein
MNSPARVHRYFRACPETDKVGSWQTSFLSFVMSWAVMMGYRDWHDIYDWYIAAPIAQCNGKSGWNRQWPTPYHWYPFKAWPPREGDGLVLDSRLDAITCVDWADAWQFFKLHTNIDDSNWDGHTIMQKQSGPAYLFYLRGVFRMAQKLEVPGAADCSRWLDVETPNAPNMGRSRGFAKWSISGV